MPTLRDPRYSDDQTLTALQAEIGRLRGRLELLEAATKRNASTLSGEWTVNRPMAHTGELLGFFGATMQARQPRPATLEDVINVLARFGLTY